MTDVDMTDTEAEMATVGSDDALFGGPRHADVAFGFIRARPFRNRIGTHTIPQWLAQPEFMESAMPESANAAANQGESR